MTEVEVFVRERHTPTDDRRVVLYGTGGSARDLLARLEPRQVVGVVDSSRTAGEWHNLPILDLSRVTHESADAIVFAMTPLAVQEVVSSRVSELLATGLPLLTLADVDLRTSWMTWTESDRLQLLDAPAHVRRSPRGLLEYSGWRGLTRVTQSADEEVILETLIRGLSLDAEGLLDSGGRIDFADARAYGYAVFGPVAAAFLTWLVAQASRGNLTTLLFAERDGYLLHRAYERLRCAGAAPAEVPGVYLPVSRALVQRANLYSPTDIAEVCRLPFAGSAARLVTTKFGLDVASSPDGSPSNGDAGAGAVAAEAESLALAHTDSILETSARLRENYRSYLDAQGLGNGAPTGFVDLVSSGTTQAGLGSFTTLDLTGLYLGKYSKARSEEALAVRSIIGSPTERPERRSRPADEAWFMQHYPALENVFTSTEGSVLGIRPDGGVVRAVDRRSADQLADLRSLHCGIEDFLAAWARLRGNRPPLEDGISSSFLIEAYRNVSILRTRTPRDFGGDFLVEDLGQGLMPVGRPL